MVTLTDLDAAPHGGIKGSLSADGKTLTITSTNALSGRYDVTIDKLKDTNGNDVVKYEGKNLDFGKDTTSPTIKEVEKVNASTIKVHFSEPLSAKGTWTYKDAAGMPVVVGDNLSADGSYVTLTIDGGVTAGTAITATVIGAKDKANNLINPNPATINFTKGALDGVKPEVSSVKSLGLNKFEVKFSEEVNNLAITDIKIDGVAIVDYSIDSTNGGTLTQDSNDKTKYVVDLKGTSVLTTGLHKIELAAAAATDLSGEDLKAFSQIVEFKADTVAPKFVSSNVKVNANKEEVLVLTFDKEIAQPVAFTTIVATELSKELVTTAGTLTAGQLKVNADNKKQLEVPLNTVKFSTANLKDGATYTVKFTKGYVDGVNGVDVEAFDVSFKRGEDGTVTTTQKPAIASATATSPDNVTVIFDKEVDGVTATNLANYSIPGLEFEKAVLKVNTGVAKEVVLTLKKGSNKLNGDRDLTVKNVKAKNGAVMETETKTVTNMKENVVPTVESAKFTGVTGGEVDKITITFSENVSVAQDAFELFIGDSTIAKATTNTAIASGGTEAKKVELTVSTPLTAEDVAKGITVKLIDGKVVADVNANALEFTSIKATY